MSARARPRKRHVTRPRSRAVSGAGVLLLAVALAGCGGSTSTSAPEAAAEAVTISASRPVVEATAGETVLRLDQGASLVRIFTYRGGKLARFGHNHVITAVPQNGLVAARPDLGGSRFAFTIALNEMVVDDAAERAAAGAGFDTRPSAEDIAATRTNMLGDDGLDAARYPEVAISGEVVGATPGGGTTEVMLRVAVTVHGQTQTIEVPASATRTSRGLRVTGRTSLSQRAFGLTPFSVMLGALTVLDNVDITFDLLARPDAS